MFAHNGANWPNLVYILAYVRSYQPISLQLVTAYVNATPRPEGLSNGNILCVSFGDCGLYFLEIIRIKHCHAQP